MENLKTPDAMEQINSTYIEAVKEIVKNSPYPKHMGMELSHIEYDRADVSLQLSGCHLQPFGIVHGGVLATVIDTATFWSAFLRLPEDTGLVNVDLKLNYLAPITKGVLVAEGVCLRPGRSISYSEARVFNAKRELVARGTSTLMALSGKGLSIDLPKFS